MAHSEHTLKLLSNVTVNAPEIITEVVRAHDHNGTLRLRHLYEAHRRILDMAAATQATIDKEQARFGAAAVPAIAARLRAIGGAS